MIKKDGGKLNRGGAVAVCHVALGTAIVCVCSLIRIPLAVPITLQTLGVFLIICVLGEKKAVFCVASYVLLGIIGLPVFSGGGGVQALFSLTGGYVVGLMLIPPVCLGVRAIFGFRPPVWVGCAVGLAVCYAVGSVWFYAIGKTFSLAVCVLPFILPDALKLCVAAVIGKRVKSALFRT